MKHTNEFDTYVYGTGWIVLSIGAVFIFLYKGLGIDLINMLPPCVFHLATGYYCPGCGGSRAAAALLTGHPIRSALYHPFFFYAVCVGGWFMLSQTIERISRGRIKIAMPYRDVYLWIAIILIAANWMIKNVSMLLWGIDLFEVIARL